MTGLVTLSTTHHHNHSLKNIQKIVTSLHSHRTSQAIDTLWQSGRLCNRQA